MRSIHEVRVMASKKHDPYKDGQEFIKDSVQFAAGVGSTVFTWIKWLLLILAVIGVVGFVFSFFFMALGDIAQHTPPLVLLGVLIVALVIYYATKKPDEPKP